MGTGSDGSAEREKSENEECVSSKAGLVIVLDGTGGHRHWTGGQERGGRWNWGMHDKYDIDTQWRTSRPVGYCGICSYILIWPDKLG